MVIQGHRVKLLERIVYCMGLGRRSGDRAGVIPQRSANRFSAPGIERKVFDADRLHDLEEEDR